MIWPLVKLKDLVEKVDKWNPIKDGGKEQFQYIDLSSVDKDNKKIISSEVDLILPSEAPSRARQIASVDDILVATVRPNLNGLARVTEEFDKATASTGYCVLRVKKAKLDARYLYYWVQTDSFIQNMMSKATGANYPAVSDKVIKESEIPLPPLEEQKRIAAILDKADAIRQKRKQAIDLADEFLRSVFLDMFGDPVANSKGWEVKSLKHGISSIISGWSAKGDNNPCCKDELGVLKISAVTTGVFKPTENKRVEMVSIPKDKKLQFPQRGDLLFSRANTRELVAATCIVHKTCTNVFLPDKLWKIKLDDNQLLPEFLHMLLLNQKFKETLTSQATGSSGSMLNISKSKFENTNAIYPPIELQKQFKNIFWKLSENTSQVNGSIKLLDKEFNSLSQKAFAGEL